MRLSRRTVLASAVATLSASAVRAQDPPKGLVIPRRFAPFNADAPRCTPPAGLRKTLIFAQDNTREFMQGAARGMELAARQRGLGFEIALANNDPAAMVDHVRRAIATHAGALITAPINVATLAPLVRQFIAQGGYVGSIVPPPATTILNAPQLETGRVLGEAAATYIRRRLGG